MASPPPHYNCTLDILHAIRFRRRSPFLPYSGCVCGRIVSWILDYAWNLKQRRSCVPPTSFVWIFLSVFVSFAAAFMVTKRRLHGLHPTSSLFCPSTHRPIATHRLPTSASTSAWVWAHNGAAWLDCGWLYCSPCPLLSNEIFQSH